MTKLPKFTLTHNDRKDRWDLIRDGSRETVRSFETKEQATKGGVLKRTVGPQGGSVKIEKEAGGYQEERTYPRKADPSKSPG